MYVINPKYSGGYTLALDAILHGVQITYTPKGVITYQSFGLDKKLSNPNGLLNFLELVIRIELMTSSLPMTCSTD